MHKYCYSVLAIILSHITPYLRFIYILLSNDILLSFVFWLDSMFILSASYVKLCYFKLIHIILSIMLFYYMYSNRIYDTLYIIYT